jgi:diphthamide synthase (EF-2-diphthine--ammonia ligase)
MAGTGLKLLFPLWGRPTRALAEEMIASGQKAVLTCVDPRALPASFAGRAFDESLLADLPASVDPCGENGEFHSFVWDGPAFARPVPVQVGEVVERDGFVFADVLPVLATEPESAPGSRVGTRSGSASSLGQANRGVRT